MGLRTGPLGSVSGLVENAGRDLRSKKCSATALKEHGRTNLNHLLDVPSVSRVAIRGEA